MYLECVHASQFGLDLCDSLLLGLYLGKALCFAFLPGDTHSQLQVSTDFSDINSDLILLPIYLLSYRYQDKVYRFLLNGQTGKLDGDKPYSTRRIAAAVVLGLAVTVVAVLLAIWLSR